VAVCVEGTNRAVDELVGWRKLTADRVTTFVTTVPDGRSLIDRDVRKQVRPESGDTCVFVPEAVPAGVSVREVSHRRFDADDPESTGIVRFLSEASDS
jgi:hypothetical protein